MRLLSNFDTENEKKLIKAYKASFGDDMVLSIHKSRWYYSTYVLFPWIFFFILFAVTLYFVYILEYPYQEFVIPTFRLLFALYFFYVFRKTSEKYVNYSMDFMIVTPKELIKYDQQGMLHRETETIHVDKIRSVTVSKHGLMNSFFDIGTIKFLAEGSDERGDIEMPFVDGVEQVEAKIRHVMGLDAKD